MDPPEIWSMTAVLNERSEAVMRRLGLRETTRFDHPRIPPGDPLRPQVAYHGIRPAAARKESEDRSGSTSTGRRVSTFTSNVP